MHSRPSHTPRALIKAAGSGEPQPGTWGSFRNAETHMLPRCCCPYLSGSWFWYQNGKVIDWAGDSSTHPQEVCFPSCLQKCLPGVALPNAFRISLPFLSNTRSVFFLPLSPPPPSGSQTNFCGPLSARVCPNVEGIKKPGELRGQSKGHPLECQFAGY